MTHLMTLRVPEDLKNLIQEQATKEDRSLSNYCRIALRSYINNKEKKL